MRRDYFTIDVRHTEASDGLPEVVLAFDGPSNLLEERLAAPSGETTLSAEEIDVTFRYTTPIEADEPTGVLSLTDRLTGEFVLETNAAADTIKTVIEAARDRTDEAGVCYRVEINADEEVIAYEKATLLVYDADGDLRRECSLIPGGVEL
jgi:hypothetical protein